VLACQVRPDIALCHLHDETDFHVIGSAAAAFQECTGGTPIVAYCRLSPSIAGLFAANVAPYITALLLRERNDLASGLRAILQAHAQRHVLRDVVTAVTIPVGAAHAIWRHCVARSLDTVLTVETLAAELHVNRRTLRNRLHAARVPSPEAVIGWSRVLVAIRLLRDPRMSMTAAAGLLRFASATDCRAMIGRYTGLPATVWRTANGLRDAAKRVSQ
jgi:AraC-like DNA-binding protein